MRDSADRGVAVGIAVVGDGRRRGETDRVGRYAIGGLRPGRVRVQPVSSFWTAEARDVELKAGETTHVDFVVRPQNRGPRTVWLGCRAMHDVQGERCADGRPIDVQAALSRTLPVFGVGVIRDSSVWARLWTRYRDTTASARSAAVPPIDWTQEMVILVRYPAHVPTGAVPADSHLARGINRVLITSRETQVMFGPDSIMSRGCCFMFEPLPVQDHPNSDLRRSW